MLNKKVMKRKYTYEYIGNKFGVSRQYVMQVEQSLDKDK